MKDQMPLKNRGLQMMTQPEFVDFEKLLDQVQDLHDSITQRAYELFEQEGHAHGRALDHWLNAEKEMLHPLPVELAETDDTLTLRADVPGFRAEDVKLSIEPRRFAISGQRQETEEKRAARKIYREHLSNRICRSVELPLEIDPAKATAIIHDGVLELSMPKALPARKIRLAARVA